MKNRLLTYCLCLLSAIVMAQSKSVLVNEGNYYFENKDYFSSIFYYELALEKDSNLVDIFYPLAESYRYTHQFAKAINYYQKVVELNASSAYPNLLLFLGLSLKNSSNYDEASRTLQQFLDEQAYPSSFWYRKGLMALKGSEFAKNLNESKEYSVVNLGDAINSSVSDFAPFVDVNGKLYFTSMEKDDGLAQETYIGHRSVIMHAEKGQIAKVYNVFNDANYHMANISFNADKTTAYFTKCKQYQNNLNCEIYSSQFKGAFWQSPQLMDQRFNPINSSNTHPKWAFWNQQEGLFISSNRIGGVGDLDIWFIPFNGSPQHLGNGINTQGKEVSPFYHPIEQTLYFSSDFHAGMGGFDIFKSVWQESWGLVSHLGKPINSSANDLYYVAQLDSPQTGYFSSNRPGSQSITTESCCNDIYAFVKTEECVCVEIDSLSKVMKLNLPLSLYFHNDEPDPNTRDSLTTLSYTQAYISYSALKDKYVSQFSAILAGNAKNDAQRKMRRFFDETVSGGYEQLQVFAQQLEQALLLGARVELRLKGFTSPLTDSDYNVLLAKRRISSMANFFSIYNDSSLSPFMSNGQLSISELPLGETQVDMDVSDNPNDRRNSVYSIKAARERRIEIQSILVEF
ncbi:MAG: tetratricopeptide repeat protein [Flavobacteriales bacterium]